MNNLKAQLVWESKCILGEGPVWDSRTGTLFFVDIKSSCLCQYIPATGERSKHDLDMPICALVPRMRGDFIAALTKCVALVDSTGKVIEKVSEEEVDRPHNRFNDGKVDAVGRFWFGSMDDREIEPLGALYSLDSEFNLRRHDEGYIVSNGPAVSAGGKTLYHTDTYRKTIYAFDLSPEGALGDKRVFYVMQEEEGYPDGMTIDAENHLWVCQFGAGKLCRLSPAGHKVEAIHLPVTSVTSCCFGGDDLATLYITTGSWQLNELQQREQPLAGGLFACQPLVGGNPVQMFGG